MNNNELEQNIYQNLLYNIEMLLTNLITRSPDNSINEQRKYAIAQLEGIKKELYKNLESLDKNSEWDTFTIAFYGETNAGKSTLIETLRIILKEKNKVKQQKEFNENYDNLNIINEKITSYNYKILEIDNEFKYYERENIKEIDKIQQELKTLEKENKAIISNINHKIFELENLDLSILENIFKLKLQKYNIDQIILNKMLNNIFYMIKSLFNKLPEQIEKTSYKDSLSLYEEALLKNKEEYSNYKKKLIKKELELKRGVTFLQEKKTTVENSIFLLKEEKDKIKKPYLLQLEKLKLDKSKCTEELEILSDGKIIGDGRSDFTQDVTEYNFIIDRKKFIILDLPGIEGKEEIVQDSINQAIEKAHVVFYISKRATPPQKGEDGNLGTIEKISKQLSQHSEVYFIYNKPVRNPRQLKHPLINEDEEQSLLDVDNILFQTLSKAYKTHLCLTAYPAFVSLGNFYNNSFQKAQEKYEQTFSKYEILDQSMVSEFSNWMVGQLVDNVKSKMIESNFKKINSVMSKTTNDIDIIYWSFYRLESDIKSNYENTFKKLKQLMDSYNNDLKNVGKEVIRQLEINLRNKIYTDIDEGINKSELKECIERNIKKTTLEFSKNIEMGMKSVSEEFNSEVSDIVSVYQRYNRDLLNKYSNYNNFDFNFTVDIQLKKHTNLKENVTSLVLNGLSILMLVVNSTNPVGWAILALSVIQPLLNAVKVIHGFIDKDFQKAQQKKSADENIAKITRQMEQKWNETTINLEDEVKKIIKNIDKEIKKPLLEVRTIFKTFSDVKDDINGLSIYLDKKKAEFYGNS